MLYGKRRAFIPMGIRKADQADLQVTALTTEYTFWKGQAQLKLCAVSALSSANLELLATPPPGL